MDLDTPLQYVKGIGPVRGEMLATKGLFTVADLLYYPPFRYEDRQNVKTIAALAPGEKAAVTAWVDSAKLTGYRRQSLGLFEANFGDASGASLAARWFHGERYRDTLIPGTRVALFGKVELDRNAGQRLMVQPELEILSSEDAGEEALHSGRIVAVYEAAGKVSTRVFRSLLDHVLKVATFPQDFLPRSVRARLRLDIPAGYGSQKPEARSSSEHLELPEVSQALREQAGLRPDIPAGYGSQKPEARSSSEHFELPELSQALRELHQPSPDTDLRLLNEFRTPAQTRLIFEEFFWLECGLALKKEKSKLASGISFEVNAQARGQIRKVLPFKPTGAQRRVMQEIADDMKRPHPMNRLLQGDVGSGKTIVAAQAAVIAIENGYQVAILAPTEILAAQHFAYFRKVLERAGYVIASLTGSQTQREKQQIKRALAEGLVKIVVGTHAMLQEDVTFKQLGLAVIDEQHRFGVRQRLELFKKGAQPDVLVMTATPIPRTLALTLYGDLDVSVIDELPPGRRSIQTRHVMESAVEGVYRFIGQQVKEGRQAYVVYALLEETETAANAKAAEQMYAHLSQTVFPDLKVGLIHGRLNADEKESAMKAFQSGETNILVATTVIEVGVDVPNATVMVIENAERFGLAQLHQLRGRVGRGAHQSFCALVTGKLNEIARERIRTLVESDDGFYIAEMDMKLRGPGEFFGTRQSGIPGLRLANLLRDGEILEQARNEARALVARRTDEEEVRTAVRYIQENWQRRYGLIQVG